MMGHVGPDRHVDPELLTVGPDKLADRIHGLFALTGQYVSHTEGVISGDIQRVIQTRLMGPGPSVALTECCQLPHPAQSVILTEPVGPYVALTERSSVASSIT